MFLQFYINEGGDRVYTLKKICPAGDPTSSAHPARFSPDDKFSRHRVTLKKRSAFCSPSSPDLSCERWRDRGSDREVERRRRRLGL